MLVFMLMILVGYGNLAPTIMFTRLFLIFYGLIGIPMNGIVMVTLGGYFAKSVSIVVTEPSVSAKFI